jgi:CheY-like chemotaxis protein
MFAAWRFGYDPYRSGRSPHWIKVKNPNARSDAPGTNRWLTPVQCAPVESTSGPVAPRDGRREPSHLVAVRSSAPDVQCGLSNREAPPPQAVCRRFRRWNPHEPNSGRMRLLCRLSGAIHRRECLKMLELVPPGRPAARARAADAFQLTPWVFDLWTVDDADVRSATVDMLRELGYRVIEAPDGPAGLRMLDAHQSVSLVFTDVGLPGGINGRQFADEAHRRKRGLPVLFTSGYARNAIVHQGRLDPGVELLVKPFTYGALAARIRRLLDEQK